MGKKHLIIIYLVLTIILILSVVCLRGISSIEKVQSGNSSQLEAGNVDRVSGTGSSLADMQSSLLDIKEDISSIETSLKNLGAEMNENYEEIMSEYLPVINQIQTNTESLIGNISSPDDAEAFLNEANVSNYPDLYYLAAIYHDPSNSLYYEQYLNYLEESNADVDSYIILGSVIENSIMSGSYAESQDMIHVYDEIMSIVSEETVPEINELSKEEAMDNWNTSVADFYEYTSTEAFEYQTFCDLYDAVVSAESDISDIITSKEESQYEAISSIYSLISSAQAIENISSNMEGSSDSVFIELYPLTSQSLSGVLSLFASRDKSIEGSYAAIISDKEEEIISTIKQLDYRYDSLKIAVVENDISSVSRTLNIEKLQEKYNELYIEFNTMVQELRRVEDFSKRIAEIQSNLEEISKQIYIYNYSRYQQWAGAEIANISKQLDSEKDKEDKLQVLVASGYFNIDNNLLIPELATAYSSLWDDNYVKNSSQPLDNLLKIYPVNKKMLGDV